MQAFMNMMYFLKYDTFRKCQKQEAIIKLYIMYVEKKTLLNYK